MEFDINIYDTYFTLQWYQALLFLLIVMVFLYGFTTILLKLVNFFRRTLSSR